MLKKELQDFISKNLSSKFLFILYMLTVVWMEIKYSWCFWYPEEKKGPLLKIKGQQCGSPVPAWCLPSSRQQARDYTHTWELSTIPDCTNHLKLGCSEEATLLCWLFVVQNGLKYFCHLTWHKDTFFQSTKHSGLPSRLGNICQAKIFTC